MTEPTTPRRAPGGLLRRRNVVRRIFPLSYKTLTVHRLIERLNGSGHPDAALAVSECWKILTGIEVKVGAQIGEGTIFVHAQGVVVGESAVIGRDCRVYQQVTLGGGRRDRPDMPVVGDHVTMYAGAKLTGALHVGDHASIGANAVVTHDVPAGAIVAGVPARIVGWHDGFGPDEPSG